MLYKYFIDLMDVNAEPEKTDQKFAVMDEVSEHYD